MEYEWINQWELSEIYNQQQEPTIKFSCGWETPSSLAPHSSSSIWIQP